MERTKKKVPSTFLRKRPKFFILFSCNISDEYPSVLPACGVEKEEMLMKSTYTVRNISRSHTL